MLTQKTVKISSNRLTELHPTSSTEYEDSEGDDGVQSGSKKIKPVDGLKLKTPIAFQKDSNLDMIPIRKEGMAVCEKCGAIGVKHSFYTKERRFCSQACAKSFNETIQMSSNNTEKRPSQPVLQHSTKKNGQPLEEVHVYSNKNRLLTKDSSGKESDKYGFDWVEMLLEPGFVTPPVSSFRHSPLCDTWTSDVNIGMKVEVENTDTHQSTNNADPQSYWVASVISLMGYKALLRYEGFGTDDSKDFWVNLAAEDVHPVGWCASKGKPLIPPRTIQDKYTEWRDFLVKRLTGARSLPNQFHNRVVEACRSRFRPGMTVELIDRQNLSTVKVATIQGITGRRLRLRYADGPSEEPAFWCHEESNLIHPVGWAINVGHRIDASSSYLDRCQGKMLLATDATSDLFNEPKAVPSSSLKFKEGMKLEAVDPLNLDSICVATVVKVLRHGYLMIRIDRSSDSAELLDHRLFCYHVSSACIAPAGFCEANAITLKPPEDYEGRFRWGDYLRQLKAVSSPECLFPVKEEREQHPNTLRVGMRVEAADLMDPRLVCVATIAQLAGRLVRVHFDGWSDEFDQWMDAASPEIYPVGWCELSGYRLEQPVVPVTAPVAKRGRKNRGSRGRPRGRPSARPSSTNLSQTAPLDSPSDKTETPSDRADGGRGPGRPPGRHRAVKNEPQRKSLDSARSLRPRKRTLGEADASAMPDSHPPKREPAASLWDGDDDAESAVEMILLPTDLKEETWNAALTPSPPTPPPPTPPPPSSLPPAPPAPADNKRIPRLIDVAPAHRREALVGVLPLDWTVQNVAHFLKTNDCTAYSTAFTDAQVDGPKLMLLSKDQVLELTDLKVGPSLKIWDLIAQLKSRVSSTYLRQKSNIQPLAPSSL